MVKTGLNGVGRGLNVDCAPTSENDGGGVLVRGRVEWIGRGAERRLCGARR